jgi:tetratricopeptide (TPR) repeat protein
MNLDSELAFIDNLSNENRKIKKLRRSLENRPDDPSIWNALGHDIYENNYWNESLLVFNKVIELDPQNEDAWLNKGKAYFALGNYDESLKCVNHSIGINEKNGDAWLNKGKAYFALGNYDESLKCVNHSIDLGYESFDSYLFKGINNYYLHNIPQSLDDFERAISLDRTNYKSWLNAGIVLIEIKNYPLAERYLRKAYELEPTENDIVRNLAYLYSDILFKFEEALELCQILYQNDPSIEWSIYLAESLLKVKQYPKSRSISRKVLRELGVEKNDDHYTISVILIICSYFLEGNIRKGYIQLKEFLEKWQKHPLVINNDEWVFAGLKKSITNNESNIETRNLLIDLIELAENGRNLDNLLQKLRKIEQLEGIRIDDNIYQIKKDLLNLYKIKLKEEGIDMDHGYRLYPDSNEDLEDIDISNTFMNLNTLTDKIDTPSYEHLDLDLIDLMIIEGRFDSAIELCNSILGRFPNNLDALLKKGLSYYRIGKSEEALNCYEAVLTIDKENAIAILHKAMILQGKGKMSEAEHLYRQVIQLNLLRKDYEGYTSKGIAFSNLGDYDLAMQQFDKAISINPRMDRAIVNKGVVFVQLGKYSEAIKWYDEALKYNKRSFLAIYNKSCLFTRISDFKNALLMLKEAIKINPHFKGFARSDKCFENLIHNKEFISILEGERHC